MEFFSIRQDREKTDRNFIHRMQSNPMKQILEKLIERESRPSQVGPRVTAIRLTVKLSKAQFADAVGVDRSSYTKIERGDAGLDIAVGERIAVLYGFGLDFIYRGDLSDVPQNHRAALMVNLLAVKYPR